MAEPLPGCPALPTLMDTLLAPQTTSLLAHAGVGRQKALQTMQAMQASARPPGLAVPGYIKYSLDQPSNSRPPQEDAR